MKPFLAFLFFLVTTLILGVGMWVAVATEKGSLWPLLAGVAGYIGLFTRYGCQTH